MKHEVSAALPAYFKETWPGQFSVFTHFEFTAGVPQALCLITTVKENGKPNACFHAWQCFTGDTAVIAGLNFNSHTYQNILREKEFCVNFLSVKHYDACLKTVEVNSSDGDELAGAGLNAEKALDVKAPRVKEAFLSMECSFTAAHSLSDGKTTLVIGRIVHAAVEEGFRSPEKICSPEGFMYNVHEPIDPKEGKSAPTTVATLRAER
ncbi:MAG TPA: flavin reductase family protein [Clostridia bacterium]|nr:flavin reductase family protein [Clostridia bacterium]